jgi:hypothetical protein
MKKGRIVMGLLLFLLTISYCSCKSHRLVIEQHWQHYDERSCIVLTWIFIDNWSRLGDKPCIWVEQKVLKCGNVRKELKRQYKLANKEKYYWEMFLNTGEFPNDKKKLL